MEHLGLDTGQRKNGQVDHHDDQLTEHQRPARLARCFEDLFESFFTRQQAALAVLRLGQPSYAVLDDHYRAIDDDAEVQCPQAHQVGADIEFHHTSQREQHGQRDDGRRDQCRAQIPEEEEQHCDHQHRTFQQVLLHGGDGLVDQVGTVIHSDHAHALGQVAIDVLHALVHRLRHGTAVLAHQHEHGAQHHFLAVCRRRAGAQFAADLDIRHITHPHRYAVRVLHDHVADIVHRAQLPRHAHQILLAAFLDIACACVVIVAVDRGHQLGNRHTHGGQPVRVGSDLVLLHIAANGVDLGHAGYVAQLRLDHPVLYLAQVGIGIGRAIGLARFLVGLYRPQVDLTETRRNRPELGRQPRWQAVARLRDALVDQLSREEDVDIILEDHGHLRQAVARQGARLLQARQARHDGLDRISDALLGLER